MNLPPLKTTLTLVLITTSLLNHAAAAPANFSTGPVFKKHGENTPIKNGLNNAEEQKFKVVFDVYKGNVGDQPHRGFNTVARFINMHVRAGVSIDNIDVALVVHGKASHDLMTDEAFEAAFGKENPSAELVHQLIKNKVHVYICGQSSSHLGITADQLNDKVTISLSAMTANALLQQQGYTLNPF